MRGRLDHPVQASRLIVEFASGREASVLGGEASRHRKTVPNS
jgi:hypothetical protein